MRKFATTATAAAVMLTGLAGASTSSDAAGSGGPSPHVTRLVSVRIEGHKVGNNHSAGVDRLLSLATHKVVGYESFSSHFNPKTDQLRFWLADALEGGIIVSSFNLNTEKTGNTFTGRITHGTGRYRGIHGTIHVRNSDSGRTVYTLRYTL